MDKKEKERISKLSRATSDSPIMALITQSYRVAKNVLPSITTEEFSSAINSMLIGKEADAPITLLMYDDVEMRYWTIEISEVLIKEIYENDPNPNDLMGMPSVTVHRKDTCTNSQRGTADDLYKLCEKTIVPAIEDGWVRISGSDEAMPFGRITPYDLCALSNFIEITVRLAYWVQFVHSYSSTTLGVMTSDAAVTDRWTLMSMSLFMSISMGIFAQNIKLPNDDNPWKSYLARAFVDFHGAVASPSLKSQFTMVKELLPDVPVEPDDLRLLPFNVIPEVHIDTLTTIIRMD